MVAFPFTLHRSAGRSVIVAVALAVLGHAAPAQAAHERPWLADKPAAHIAQTIALPGKAVWRQVVPLADRSVILLREQSAGDDTPFLARLAPGASETVPLLPDWSGIDTGERGATGFAPTALSTDDRGGLWLIDQAIGAFPPRLIHLEPLSGKVLAEFPLPSEGVTKTSRFTSLVVHGQTAYLADEGGVSLTVFDLGKRQAMRFFAGYPTSRGHAPLVIDHKVISGPGGHPLTRDIAFLALEANGKWLYELTPTGPIFRLSTDLLTDPEVTPSEMMEGVTQWRGTPTLGGVTIDDKATLYLTDIENGRVLSFDAQRLPHILLSSPQLIQAGLPGWAKPQGADDASGQLYIPAGHTLLRIDLP